MYKLNLICIFSLHTSDSIMSNCVCVCVCRFSILLFTFFSFPGIFQNQSMLITFHNALEYSRYFSDMGKCLNSCICFECPSKPRLQTTEEGTKKGCSQSEVQIAQGQCFSLFLKTSLWSAQIPSFLLI